MEGSIRDLLYKEHPKGISSVMVAETFSITEGFGAGIIFLAPFFHFKKGDSLEEA